MNAVIRLFKPDDAKAFHDLNVAWIEQYFELEEKDRKTLEHPDQYILGKNGRIVVADLDGVVVGTAALIPIDDDTVELAKMCVDASQRGAGIGKAILKRIDVEAADMGARAIWLESNTVLEAAIRLYETCGYKTLTEDECTHSPYARCNTQMKKHLSQ